MITFFTTARDFTGLFDIIQTNAITSWTKLEPKCEVIILGNEVGADRISKELGLVHVPDINYGKHGGKYYYELFKRAEEISSNEFLCYINADIILTDDFMKAFGCLAPLKRPWLMVGRRYNLVIENKIDVRDPLAVKNVKAVAVQENRMTDQGWIDYFLYTKGLFNNIPPFVTGAWRWDNWMVNKALSIGAIMVDATRVVTAIHQDHDLPGYEKIRYTRPGTEEKFVINSELFEKYALYNSMYDKDNSIYEIIGTIDYATHVLDKDGLKKKKILLRERINRFLILEPYRRPCMKAPCRLCHKLMKSLKVLENAIRWPLVRLWYKRVLPVVLFPRNYLRKLRRKG